MVKTINITQPVSKRNLILFFVLTIPLAWLFWIPMIFIQKNLWVPPIPIPTLVWSSLGGISPLMSLAIIEGLSKKQVTLQNIFTHIRLREWRKPKMLLGPLYLIAMNLILIVIHYGTMKGTEPLRIFNDEVFEKVGMFILLIIPLHFITGLVTSPLFEEPGWRGFAFEHLRAFIPRDLASLLVGSYWWLWHQGMNLAFDIQPSLWRYLSMLMDSWTIDTLYLINNGNILAAMLVHQAMGTVFTFFSPLPEMWNLLLIKLLMVLLLRFIIAKSD